LPFSGFFKTTRNAKELKMVFATQHGKHWHADPHLIQICSKEKCPHDASTAVETRSSSERTEHSFLDKTFVRF
jgi:hypothetical protein